MGCLKILPCVFFLGPGSLLSDTFSGALDGDTTGCLIFQDDRAGLMHSEADVENFAEILRNADEQGVRECLQRDPGLAVAKLPSGWPVSLEQSMFPEPTIIDLMIASGADPDARSPEGETLLHLTGDPEAIRKLLSHGADINALDRRGYTPMMGHAPYPETGPDAIYTLFAEGADPHVHGLDGKTVFDLLPQGERFDRIRRHLRDKDQNR